MERKSVKSKARFTREYARLAVLLGVCAAASGAAPQDQSAKPIRPVPTEPPARKQDPLIEQHLVGGFWRTDHTFKASIRITNNLSIAPLSVTPVLYMADGTEFPLAPVQVPKSSVATVSINDALAAAPVALSGHLSTHGSAALKYTWRWQGAVTGSIVSLDVPRSLTFTSMFMPPSSGGDTNENHAAEGLWWTPFPGSDGFVGLTNTSGNSLSAVIQSFGAAGNALDTVTEPIGPFSTRFLALKEFVSGGTRGGMGGIRVSYQGPAKALVVNGGIEDGAKGYSAAIPFTMPMPGMMESNASLASAGIMIGRQDPMMGFPKNTTFRPYAFLRNVSSKVVTVKPTVSYQMGGEPESIPLPPVQLLPNQVASLFPASGLASKTVQHWDGSFNLLIATDAPPISVVTATGSVDQTGTYVFEVEPEAVATTAAKMLPYWNTANGNDTMISLWNPTSKPQDLVLTVPIPGAKQYRYPIHLRPSGSAMLSVKEIQSMGTSDVDGNVLPKEMTSGSAMLASAAGIDEDLNVSVSVGTFNVLTATCGTMWPTCLGYNKFWVAPEPFPIGFGSDGDIASYAQNTSGGVSTMTSKSTWSSSNTSMAQVVSAGVYYGTAVGSFNATAQANLISVSQDCVRGGPCATDPWEDSSPGNVINVQITTADVTLDKIAVVLSGAAGSSGQLVVQVTGASGQSPVDPVANATEQPGSYNFSFGLGNIPIGEYTTVTATWTVNGEMVTANYSYHFKVLGTYVQTAYNTPSESSCSGTATAVTLWNSSCHATTGNTLLSGFTFRVADPTTGTGSGNSIHFGSVFVEQYCTAYSTTNFRDYVTITGTLGPLSNASVAACAQSELYSAGQRVFIQGEGVKTVTDSCPACCKNAGYAHLDNYSTSTQCSGLTGFPNALTIRLY